MLYQWSITKKGKNIDIGILKKNPRQYYALSILRKGPIYKNELTQYNISNYALIQLIKKNLCYLHSVAKKTDCKKNIILDNINIKLTVKEYHLIKKIFSTYNTFKVWLLMGIHNFSKIKIYLKLIVKFLNKGLQILIIVPNIKIIEQHFYFFKIYFNVPIDVFHSNLTHDKKISVWFRTKNNENSIVIGTKKAIFIPFFKLGIIIFDEEHNIDYKNKIGWLYHARDLSILRASQENIPIILESIAPTLETLHNVINKKWICIDWTNTLHKKNNITQKIIDIKNNKLQGGLSIALINKIYQHIDQNKTVLLIVNNHDCIYFILSCDDCTKIAACVQCNEYYVWNNHYKELFCNFCITKFAIPKSCMYCGSISLIIKKYGIKNIKKCLKKIFFNVPILHTDEKKNYYENITNKNNIKPIFKKSCIVLIKEKDIYNINFLNIDLVGILSIDTYLTLMNFRAIEKLAQFYTNVINQIYMHDQCIEVFIQTSYPNHSAVRLLMQKDYSSLSQILLNERKIAQLPPFTYHAFIIVQSTNYDNIKCFFANFKNIVNNKKKYYKNSLWMMGPFPDLFLSDKSKYYVYKLLLQDSSRQSLHILLKNTIAIINDCPISKKVKWSLDIDPIDE